VYNFDFDLIKVSRNNLEIEREQNFNFERSGW